MTGWTDYYERRDRARLQADVRSVMDANLNWAEREAAWAKPETLDQVADRYQDAGWTTMAGLMRNHARVLRDRERDQADGAIWAQVP